MPRPAGHFSLWRERATCLRLRRLSPTSHGTVRAVAWLDQRQGDQNATRQELRQRAPWPASLRSRWLPWMKWLNFRMRGGASCAVRKNFLPGLSRPCSATGLRRAMTSACSRSTRPQGAACPKRSSVRKPWPSNGLRSGVATAEAMPEVPRACRGGGRVGPMPTRGLLMQAEQG